MIHVSGSWYRWLLVAIDSAHGVYRACVPIPSTLSLPRSTPAVYAEVEIACRPLPARAHDAGSSGQFLQLRRRGAHRLPESSPSRNRSSLRGLQSEVHCPDLPDSELPSVRSVLRSLHVLSTAWAQQPLCAGLTSHRPGVPGRAMVSVRSGS